MATGTAYGTNFSAVDNAAPNTVIPSTEWGGKVQCIVDSFTAAAQYDAGSKIKIGKIKKGQQFLFGIVKFTGSSTATAKIGTQGLSSDDDDYFGTVTALTTTPTQIIMPTVKHTPMTANCNIEILTAAAAIVTGEILDVLLFFSDPS